MDPHRWCPFTRICVNCGLDAHEWTQFGATCYPNLRGAAFTMKARMWLGAIMEKVHGDPNHL